MHEIVVILNITCSVQKKHFLFFKQIHCCQRRAVDLEDEDVKEILDGSLFDQLKQKTDIQVCNLSTTTLSFFSYNQPRKYQFFAVKKKDQTFDLVERADVNFIETIVLHL